MDERASARNAGLRVMPHLCAELLETVASRGYGFAAATPVEDLPTELADPDVIEYCRSNGWVEHQTADGVWITDAGIAALQLQRASHRLAQKSELPDRCLECLEALVTLKAVSAESRVSGERVMQAAFGKQADANSVKGPLATLTGLGLAASKRGRSGGAWITEAGIAALRRHRPINGR